MKTRFSLILILLTSAAVYAGDVTNSKKAITPAEEERWKFMLASPGFMAGVEGDVGIDGVISDLDVGFGDILPRIDMVWATRAEASKGRFGILGELIYLSMSDGVGTTTAVKKVDVRVDEYLADFALRWRVVEGERGYVDVIAGVRYTNLYQELGLQANDQRIGEVAEEFTDEVAERLRERIDDTLSEGRFRTALRAAATERITDRLLTVSGPDTDETLPIGPLAGSDFGRLGRLIDRIVQDRTRDLVASARDELRQAAEAEAAAIRAAAAAERTRLQARAAALRTRVDERIADGKKDIEDEVEKTLKKNLHRRISREDDWWDPYVGIRARYNFTPAIYATGRCDIGGFTVGSDLMWQAEAALGFQVTRSIFAELGYRAISFDYEKDGLINETITHGAQVTLGINF